jgi:hypothetical protein
MVEAEQLARHFFGKVHKSMQNCVAVSVEKQDTLLYVFNADNGFVVVSGEKKAAPILAYSYENNYDAEHVIPPVQMWMNSYHKQLLALRQNATLQQSISVSKAWKELQTPSPIHKNTSSPATPLLTSKWGQGTYYNFYCPKDEEGVNKRVVTGCVATAMAQLMYYFRFPQHGSDNYSYTHPVYGMLSADFENAQYDYSSMVDKPNAINPAICLLIAHCGIAVDMNYGPTSSGMYNHKAACALKTYFNFSPQTQYVFRDSTTLDWDSLIVTHLDNKIPLYYAGWSVPDTDGHGFICDAYQVDSSSGNYYYHFNFGWDGNQDAYFFTDALSPGGNNFNLAQELIINAFPDTLKLPYPVQALTGTTTLTTETGSFTNGIIHDCPPNMDYTWIIQPDVDRITQIQFSMRYNLAEGDTLFVTSPNETLDTAFSNNTHTFSANVKEPKITVRLKTTNDTLSSGGFAANYAALYDTYCQGGIDEHSTKQGSFEDGSGNNRYNNFAYCRYRINVKGVKSITLHFNKFETEKDKDILYIHNNVGDNPLLMALSGTHTDSTYTFNTNALFLIFETNEKNIDQGWELSYDADVAVDILPPDNVNNDSYFSIYPNPSTNYLYVTVNDLLEEGQLQLFDIYGKLLLTHTLNKEVSQINLNPLAAGMYIVKVMNGKKETCQTKKFIKY